MSKKRHYYKTCGMVLPLGLEGVTVRSVAETTIESDHELTDAELANLATTTGFEFEKSGEE